MTSVSKHCIDCTRRKVGCHATCKDYLEGRAEYDRKLEKIREAKRREKDINAVEFDCKFRIIERTKRLHGRK